MEIDLDDPELITKLQEAAKSGEIRFTDKSGKKITIKVEQGLPGQAGSDFGERDADSHIFRPAQR